MVSGTNGEFISNDGVGLINAYVGRPGAAVQIRVPQVQFPAPISIIPHQQYLLYNLQPLQLSFFNLQQPKVTTQCCMVSSAVPSGCSSNSTLSLSFSNSSICADSTVCYCHKTYHQKMLLITFWIIEFIAMSGREWYLLLHTWCNHNKTSRFAHLASSSWSRNTV